MQKIGMSLMISHPDKLSIEEQIPLFADIGFDSFFLSSGVTSSFDGIPHWAKEAEKNNIVFEAIHAPSDGVNDIWREGIAGDGCIARIKHIVDLCSCAGIEKIVMHTACGDAVTVSDIGIKRYAELNSYAERASVRMCYENGDVIPHLLAVMEHSSPYHGFCLDTGHHLCYAPQVPLFDLLGRRMMYTHIHDNFGITRPGSSGNDMHLLPFDGNLDWQWFADSLNRVNYSGTLNLELSCYWNENYKKMTYREFVSKAYERIIRLRSMTDK